MANKRLFGASRQVRKVQIVTPSTSLSNLSRRVEGERVSTVLGFRARAVEEAKVRERVREQYVGMCKNSL